MAVMTMFSICSMLTVRPMPCTKQHLGIARDVATADVAIVRFDRLDNFVKGQDRV